MTDNDRVIKPEPLRDHESGVRRMVSDASGAPYVAFKSLEMARRDPDGVVVLEGDDGGQIYVVARVSKIRCSEEALADLLSDVDSHAWRDPSAARLFFERHAVGEGISGGMGGGVVADAVWVHPKLNQWRVSIEDVLAGVRRRITSPAV